LPRHTKGGGAVADKKFHVFFEWPFKHWHCKQFTTFKCRNGVYRTNLQLKVWNNIAYFRSAEILEQSNELPTWQI
jgi:hypothetical protein